MDLNTAFTTLKYTPETKAYILSLYNYAGRDYHNQQHLASMLRWISKIPALGANELRIVLEAIIFHDIIYCDTAVPPAFNEACSIATYSCMKAMQKKDELDFSEIEPVIEAINATAHHLKDQDNLSDLSQLVLDLDLQSFALPRNDFVKDSEAVISEIMNQGHDRKKVVAGNKAFLKALLKRKNLYYIMTDWEEVARENLEWRIKTLK
jgi:predicted metal-dependent HD superfamily phosphohydrolase